MTGYIESWKNNIQTNVTLEQKLDFITKGLKFIGRFGYDTENSNWIKRVKWPELYKAEPYRDVNGDLIFTRLSEEKKTDLLFPTRFHRLPRSATAMRFCRLT